MLELSGLRIFQGVPIVLYFRMVCLFYFIYPPPPRTLISCSDSYPSNCGFLPEAFSSHRLWLSVLHYLPFGALYSVFVILLNQ